MEGKVRVVCQFCGHGQELIDEDLLGGVHFKNSQNGVYYFDIDHTCEECGKNSINDEYTFCTSRKKETPPHYIIFNGKILKQDEC